MRDALALRRVIESMLVSALVGCTREPPAPANIEPDPTPKKRVEPSATVTASASETIGGIGSSVSPLASLSGGGTIGPAGHPNFGCQPQKYCTPASDAAKVALAGSGTKLGCPAALDPKTKSLGYFMSGLLDETNTKAARSRPATATECCYALRHPCMGGRPLVDDDVAQLAPLRTGAGWMAELGFGELNEREGLAWLEDAQMEHASVASFARASLELLAVGAPAELVAECHRAALDEIEHARLCFAMAARCLGRTMEPGPLPIPAPRPCSLIDVARSTLIEGCFAETVAALVAMRTPATGLAREVLDRIARDETAHAALAFRILRWCVSAGGDDVARAIAAVEIPIHLTGDTAAAREAWSLVVRPLLALEEREVDASGILNHRCAPDAGDVRRRRDDLRAE